MWSHDILIGLLSGRAQGTGKKVVENDEVTFHPGKIQRTDASMAM